jgi:hypothetical protein
MVKKPMVYYTEETPGVNKRLVAGYYLFLCLIGFAILLGPTGSGIPITLTSDRVREAHELAQPNWGDNDSLSCTGTGCHDDTWDYWNATPHSGYLIDYDPDSDTITVNGHRNRTMAEFNATCAQCHAINWDNSTYPNTHDGFGTTCLTCHDTSTPYYTVDGSNCATCHIHEGHGGLDGYTESKHANSLTDLRTSSHAGFSCMHCMSAEGFIDQAGDYDPADTSFSPLTCPACHSVHSEDSSNFRQLRADNATELCGMCHVGSHHPTYTVWRGGAHDLADVECTDCHGFQAGSHGPEMNHSFYVDLDDACGQSDDCHNGTVEWAINQLEEIQSSFHDLVEDLETEATAFETIVMAYNDTADADQTLVNYVLDEIDAAVGVAHYYDYDGSAGFHDPTEIFGEVNEAFRDLLDAKAYFYENMPDAPTPTPTTPPPGGFDTLILVGGAAGGIFVGLLLGVLVGRRR